MFRPMVPNVPALGGTMTEPLFAKHPPVANVLASGAFAAQFDMSAAELEGTDNICVTPAADTQLAPLGSTVKPPVPFGTAANPEQYGIEFAVPLKSDGFPKKSQRSVKSLVPL